MKTPEPTKEASMAITGKLTIIDDDTSESETIELDAPEIDSIIDSLRDCGYPRLASRLVHAIDPEYPVARS